MTPPRPPKLEPRRTSEFTAELRERARAWIADWELNEGERDFGRALLEIAARFNSEVAERLDRVGEKMQKGFLDWLAVRGEAARPARVPVAFALGDAAQTTVLASAPVRLQADANGVPVVFETERDVQIIPGRVEAVIAVDLANDAFYAPPPGLGSLKPLEPMPMQWTLKSSASAGSTLQLDPAAGLSEGDLIEVGGGQYEVDKVDGDLVTIKPKLDANLEGEITVSKVASFSPFDGITRNQQEHALYLGDADLLNIEGKATIQVVGAEGLGTDVSWEYWGKAEKDELARWQPLVPVSRQQWTELGLSEPENALVLRKGKKGSFEEHEVNGHSSRWIRSVIPQILPEQVPFTTDKLKLLVNCTDERTPELKTEAMANSTPLVFNKPFNPFGREPRQFDAFYLGCAEAFSKQRASVQIRFEMSDATCQAFIPVQLGGSAGKFLAGVGKDRSLHLFELKDGSLTKHKGPLRPPSPFDGEVVSEPAVFIGLSLRCQPVIWRAGDAAPDDFFVAVGAGRQIWTWHENSVSRLSGWKRFGPPIPDTPGREGEIEDIVVFDEIPTLPGAALCGGRFWVFDKLSNTWSEPPKQPLPPPPATPTPLQNYAAIVPVRNTDGTYAEYVVGVAMNGKLHRLKVDGSESKETDLEVDGATRPIAMDDGDLRVVGVCKGNQQLFAIMFSSSTPLNPWSDPQLASLSLGSVAVGAQVISAEIETLAGRDRQYLVGVKSDVGAASIGSWVPTFDVDDSMDVHEWVVTGAFGEIGGTPSIAAGRIIVPGGRADAFIADFDQSTRLEFTTKEIREGVIAPSPGVFVVGDIISANFRDGRRREWKVREAPSVREAEVLYVAKLRSNTPPMADAPELIGYEDVPGHDAIPSTSTSFEPQPPDASIEVGMVLRVASGRRKRYCRVTGVSVSGDKVDFDTSTQLPSSSDPVSYRKPKFWPDDPSVLSAYVLPVIEFDPAGAGTKVHPILEKAAIYFPESPLLEPSRQKGIAFGADPDHCSVVALTTRWTSNPPPFDHPTPFTADTVTGHWQNVLSDTPINPALSWEYWNGTGWWSLNIESDGTEHLAVTGSLSFEVPSDLTESDWSGRTNFWIRARLVGGDYGREEVIVHTKPALDEDNNPTNETVQTVERSIANIRAPLVLQVDVSYAICKALFPSFVLTQDSGGFRDQSDANRTDRAMVEAFVPLAETLRRLGQGAGVVAAAAAHPARDPKSDSPCECHPATALVSTTQQNDPASRETTKLKGPENIAGDANRQLFIGLSGMPAGGPVNLFTLVDQEQTFDAYAPMSVDMLASNRFTPLVAQDATRALGESGLVTLTFSTSPTQHDLFGKEGLYWVRLKPQGGGDADWKPSLGGVYVNAAWTSATETLTRELLGSSDGTPGLTVRLARPPVLQDSLELRVREPLGEEERKAMNDEDPDSVKSDVEGLPGDWVLWRQVADPDDEAANERVYALDETTGAIHFGDGRHGKIPPIGRDAIVAFRYGRTEPGPPGSDDVPSNTIGPRTALNLVTPLEAVEIAMTADQAAGGAPPDSPDRVLKFGFSRLRHRGRAVTARDLEELALDRSSNVVQARVFASRGRTRLVVVMGGATPGPDAAQRRELRRALLEAGPTSLSLPNALEIEGPVIRYLRIELKLFISSLDYAGAVADAVNRKLTAYFSPAFGGSDETGWPLGMSPSKEHVSLALLDTPHLESIEQVDLYEVKGEGNMKPWQGPLKEYEISLLAKNPIEIHFDPAEAVA